MATIEEIPILSEEAQPDEVDPVTEEAPVEEEPTAPAPKKRGRPAGAKNKAKPKIVARPKKKAPPPPPSDDEEEESDEEEPPPPPPRRTRSRAPQQEEYEEEPPMDARSVATEMLQLLSQRHVDRNQAKRQKYASWFPNRAVY